MCTCDSTETVATSLSLVRHTTPKQCSIFLGKTTVSSSSLWTAGTPSFPSQPFKCTDTLSSISTLRFRHWRCWRSVSPCWASVSHGRRGLCCHQLDAFLSGKLPFPSSLHFYLHFTERPLLTGNEFKSPRLYVTQLPIFKTVLSI